MENHREKKFLVDLERSKPNHCAAAGFIQSQIDLFYFVDSSKVLRLDSNNFFTRVA